MFARMLSVAVNELVIVAFEFQGQRHVLIRQRPVSIFVIQIIGTVLKENADRFFLGLSDQEGINVSAADVHETADHAEHFAELIGPFPGDGERTNSA